MRHAYVEMAYNFGHERVQFGERDVFPDTNPGTSSERQDRPVHLAASCLGFKPTLGSERISIFPKHLWVQVDNAWIATDAPSRRYEVARELDAVFGGVSLHAKSYAWMKSHGLFDGSPGVAQSGQGLGVADWRAKAGTVCINLFAALGELFRMLHQEV